MNFYEQIFSRGRATGEGMTHFERLFAAKFGGSPPPEVREYTGAVPVTITADGTPLLDYLISGNMVQSGTPTPDSPIQPQGTGERTGNLLNLSSYSETSAGISDIVINGNSITFNASSQFLAIVYEFNLGISDVYTLALGGESFHTRLEIRYTKDGVNVGSAIVIQPNRNATISGSEEYNGFRVYISNANNTGTCTASNIMLNLGSTTLPYEPWGNKIPISSANTTTPVYLGEVQTTRLVKKLVFDGTENWYTAVSSTGLFGIQRFEPMQAQPFILGYSAISNCYVYNPVQSGVDAATVSGEFAMQAFRAGSSWQYNFFIKDGRYDSLIAWKAYLAQQYANGTPVCVWYVLANEETAVVNEPLMRIGDYADTVNKTQAGVSIPTNNGSTTVDVDTTVKPSEVYIKYMG